MLNFQTNVQTPKADWNLINREAKKLADDISLHVQSQLKIALVGYKAIATGKTLKSISTERILDSPSRGQYLRKIIASEVWKFIQLGRRPNGKLPPEKAMLEWFRVLGIPKKSWFPIRLSIARKGIKPRKIVERALRESRPYIAGRTSDAGRTIRDGLLKSPRAGRVQ